MLIIFNLDNPSDVVTKDISKQMCAFYKHGTDNNGDSIMNIIITMLRTDIDNVIKYSNAIILKDMEYYEKVINVEKAHMELTSKYAFKNISNKTVDFKD